jgi:alpha-glucosidase
MNAATKEILDARAHALQRPWWQGGVIYQIYPRSFADSNGDGIGDLPGIIAKLDYVAALGVDAIWISPFFKSPMRDFGYDVSDHCAIDPIFGTLADFDTLLAKAHALGLKIVVDQVYSHTSDQHPWFQASRSARTGPYADWYVWADAKPDGTPPNNWQSVFGGPAWTWDGRRRQYYLHNFLSTQPDLDVHNPHVVDALHAIARFWFDRGVDGVRLDAANFFMHDRHLRDNPVNTNAVNPGRPYQFQKQIHNISQPENLVFLETFRAMMDEYSNRFAVAELGEAPFDVLADYCAPAKRLHSGYNFAFLYQQHLTPALVRDVIEGWQKASKEAWACWPFSNHDAPRAVSRFGKGKPSIAYARLLNAVLLSLEGSIFLYYGEELGLTQVDVPFEQLVDPEALANWPHTLGRDGARTPMPWDDTKPFMGFSQTTPWLPLGAEHGALCVARQQQDPNSTLNLTRALLGLRRKHPALRLGHTRFHASSETLLMMERVYEDEQILCVFNFSDVRQSVALPEALNSPDGWSLLLTLNDAMLEGGAGTHIAPCTLSLNLPPYGALFLHRVQD